MTHLEGGAPRRMARRPAWTAGPLPWLAALLGMYLVAPLFGLLGQLDVGAVRGLFTGAVGSALLVSAGAATVSSVIIALGGVPLGYVLARGRGRWLGAVGVLVQLPLALPPLASGILLLFLTGPYTALGRLFGGGLTDSFVGVVMAQTFVAAPFLIIAARSAFRELSPSIEGVAATLGYRPWARWRRFLLPLAWPGIRAGLLLAWVRAFGEFGATAVVAYHPYTLPVLTWVEFGSTGLPDTLPIILLTLAAAGVFLILSQSQPTRRRRPADEAHRFHAVRAPIARQARDPGATLAFDLRRDVPGFDLRLAHVCASRQVVVLGPSGSGKSMFLRLLAGLEPLARGDGAQVRFGAIDWSALPSEVRRIGYVPQDYGLFRHLTVWEHLTAGVGASPAAAREWLRRLHLDGLEERFPDELSGGQRQRVALGRALVPAPEILLLDEPFSALDAPVRHELRADLRRLQRETGVATLIVTHDPQEATLLAEEILVLSAGRLLQTGALREVASHPRSPAVARLLGARNVLDGIVTVPGRLDCQSVSLPADATLGVPTGTHVTWSVAPEHVRFAADGPLPARVIDVYDVAGGREVELALGEQGLGEQGLRLIARPDGDPGDLIPGRTCSIDIPPHAVVLLDGVITSRAG